MNFENRGNVMRHGTEIAKAAAGLEIALVGYASAKIGEDPAAARAMIEAFSAVIHAMLPSASREVVGALTGMCAAETARARACEAECSLPRVPAQVISIRKKKP
jgi:hypothetical protein